ncbi:MAG: pyridoxamine 5'-phosphate oxidase [Acidimicrobiales bacterium]
MRERYHDLPLREVDVDPDPMVQFGRWFEEWVATEPYDPNATVLATVDPDGWPEARALLLKGIDERGFSFYTNRASAKACQLESSPRGALCFLWHPVERQVRVRGPVELLSDDESDAYFASRPRESQLGAWASPQSSVIADRSELEMAITRIDARFPERVPRPPQWGGYLLRPRVVELWQGRRGRLHDRLRYRRVPDTDDGAWVIERLAP